MIKIFKNLNKKDYFLMPIIILLIVLQVYLELRIPEYMTQITTLVKTSGTINEILTQGIYMTLCAFLSLISSVIVGYIVANITANFSLNVRRKLFTKVNDFSLEEIKKFSTSSLITRTTNDVTNLEMLLSMGLQLLIKAPITAIWAIKKILGKNFTWSVVTGSAVLVLVVMIVVLVILVLPKFKLVQKLIDKINGLTRENLKGIRVIRAFNAEEFHENKFERQNKKLTDIQIFNQKVMSITSPVMYLIMNGVSLAIYFTGAYMLDSALFAEKIDLFSNMVVFTSYAMQVISSFLMLAIIFIMYPRASISADRINEVLDTKCKIKNGKISEGKAKGKVEFKNVSFKYSDSDEYVLKDVSFTADPGMTVAIIGSTGSGKSTLINLITRFYDASEGAVLVDDVDVREYKLSSLYDKLGYVSQKAILFSGSIKDNVSFGEKSDYKVTDDKIKSAIRVSQSEDFVLKLKDKYNSSVSQGGSNLSGGQKQRISIARAIARDPEIYIFDDSFSALDYKTDYTLRHELKKYTSTSTNIIVAQRIGTIINSDMIIVLDKGIVVGKGTHKELMKNCDVYKEIAYSQLSKEELEHE
mgnify:CR=1 FL=1